jgi:UDP-N-acetylglucosamine 4,6-dehydratase
MCPSDLCFDTYEFDDHFVIAPGIKFSSRSNSFDTNALNERGKKVEVGFEYSSLSNPHFLTIEEIAAFNIQALL